VPVVVVTPTPGFVVVLVEESSATPLVLRYVERVLSVCLPSAPTALLVVVVLSVPGAGAISAGGATVVVVVDCAAAMPVINPSTVAVVKRSLVMRYLSGDVSRRIRAGTPK
jgi:hypothetical protein